MAEMRGICETHELPLDGNGECELCRLNLVPSKASSSPSAWWALIIPLLLLGAALAWALSSFGSKTEVAPQRGVQTAQPRTGPAAPVTAEPTVPEREREIAPPPAEPPTPGQEIPIDEIPVPEPPTDQRPEDAEPVPLPRP